jgi:carbon monoxide dehydrogenase subunit G
MPYLEGDSDLLPPPAEVWNKLGDPGFLAQCIPGVEGEPQVTPKSLTCTLRPGFAFVRGTLELTLAVTERVPESFLQYLLTTKGIGSSSEVEANVTVTPQATGTRLHWKVEIKSLGGLLKMVPPGLIQAGAQKVIADALAIVAAKLRS